MEDRSKEKGYEVFTDFDGVDKEVAVVVEKIRRDHNGSGLSAADVASSLEGQGFKQKRDFGLQEDHDYRYSFARGDLLAEVYEMPFYRGDFQTKVGPFARVKIRSCEGRYLYQESFN
jgi:hypothetical protein